MRFLLVGTSHISQTTEKSIRKIERFESVHIRRCILRNKLPGHGLSQFIITPFGGWGEVKQIVRCIRCGVERDITDVDLW